MCALKVHIKSSIFENIFSKIEKTVNIFSIPKKIFSKIINYCVSLEHTLVKKKKIYIYIAFLFCFLLTFTQLKNS